jgi:RimJ/RimL family protein N-acetyltransferase
MSDARLNFIAPAAPDRSAADGRYARVELLDTDRHSGSLWEAVRESDEIWRFMAYGPFEDRASFNHWLATRAALADPLAFAVVDLASRRALGLLSLMEIRPAHSVIEIGNVLFSPALQRTRVATEAIHLVVNRLFQLGYRRIEWKCDDRNEASKRAALRYGFVAEGRFRQHMIVKGENRDTAWFALLDYEWPRRDIAFRRWLTPENFDDAGRQRRRLEDLREA